MKSSEISVIIFMIFIEFMALCCAFPGHEWSIYYRLGVTKGELVRDDIGKDIDSKNIALSSYSQTDLFVKNKGEVYLGIDVENNTYTLRKITKNSVTTLKDTPGNDITGFAREMKYKNNVDIDEQNDSIIRKSLNLNQSIWEAVSLDRMVKIYDKQYDEFKHGDTQGLTNIYLFYKDVGYDRLSHEGKKNLVKDWISKFSSDVDDGYIYGKICWLKENSEYYGLLITGELSGLFEGNNFPQDIVESIRMSSDALPRQLFAGKVNGKMYHVYHIFNFHLASVDTRFLFWMWHNNLYVVAQDKLVSFDSDMKIVKDVYFPINYNCLLKPSFYLFDNCLFVFGVSSIDQGKAIVLTYNIF